MVNKKRYGAADYKCDYRFQPSPHPRLEYKWWTILILSKYQPFITVAATLSCSILLRQCTVFSLR